MIMICRELRCSKTAALTFVCGALSKMGPGKSAQVVIANAVAAASQLSTKDKWATDGPGSHKDIFLSCGMKYPPCYDGEEFETFRLATQHMCERYRQIVFSHSFRPCQGARPNSFHDLHMNLKWQNSACDILPCITCTSVLWSVGLCRTLRGAEELSAQGFPLSMLPSNCSDRELRELAGNAFNGWVFLAIIMAAMAALPWAVGDDAAIEIASGDGSP